MKKRDFIKIGALGAIGLSTRSLKANRVSPVNNAYKGFSLPQNISSTSTNSVFSNASYKLHLQDHLVNTNKQLNNELEHVPFVPGSVREIISKNAQFSSKLSALACNYYNHKLFFKLIAGSNQVEVNTNLQKVIDRDFGSIQAFQKEFISVGRSLNSDGWVWLINQNNSLKIVSTANNNNPLIRTLPNSQKGFPIIGVDLFEHAFKSDYSQNKELYITAVMNNLNWAFANKRFIRSAKNSKV